jgi:putative glutamine amidotransferase
MSAAERPVIGICAVRERARWAFWDQAAHLVADSYVAPLQRAGGLAVLLAVDARAPLELLDRIDGLMLIGGADIDPAAYRAERDAATEATYPERDAFEVALLLGAIDRGLPVLGICRGMQVLNIALGGTLEQNLVDADGSTTHRRVLGTFDGNEHTVTLAPGSLAARAVGEDVHVARCHHHQAVADLGAGLVITGRADADGVIEAIELADGRWALGVQWHPEADDRSRLFAALVDAARTRLFGTVVDGARAPQRTSNPVSPSGSSSRTSTLSTSA